MSELEKRILCVMTALCLVANIAAFASGVWCERDLEKQGISIERILAEHGRK